MKAFLACAAIVLCVVLIARADDHKGGDGVVQTLMERTHEGRRSPYGQLREIVAGHGSAAAV